MQAPAEVHWHQGKVERRIGLWEDAFVRMANEAHDRYEAELRCKVAALERVRMPLPSLTRRPDPPFSPLWCQVRVQLEAKTSSEAMLHKQARVSRHHPPSTPIPTPDFLLTERHAARCMLRSSMS